MTSIQKENIAAITNQSGETHSSLTSAAKSTTSSQSMETHLHTGNFDAGHQVTKAPQKLYNPPPTGHWELANPHAEIYKILYDGVKFKHELDARAQDLDGATEVRKQPLMRMVPA